MQKQEDINFGNNPLWCDPNILQYLILCLGGRAKCKVISVADSGPALVVHCVAADLLAVFGFQLVLNVRQLLHAWFALSPASILGPLARL